MVIKALKPKIHSQKKFKQNDIENYGIFEKKLMIIAHTLAASSVRNLECLRIKLLFSNSGHPKLLKNTQKLGGNSSQSKFRIFIIDFGLFKWDFTT